MNFYDTPVKIIQLPGKKHTVRIYREFDGAKSTPKKKAYEYYVDLYPPGAEISVKSYTHVQGKSLFHNDIRLRSMPMAISLAKKILSELD